MCSEGNQMQMQKQNSFKRSFGQGNSSRSNFDRPRNPYFIKPRSNSRPPQQRRRGFSEQIDFSRFIKRATTVVTQKATTIVNKFSDFALTEILQRNLDKRSYITPTPIQDQAIKPIMAGRDLIGLANTGTGKTAAFLLPLIDKVYKNRSEKVLIIAPTRELALQIDTEFRQFSWDMKIFSAACVGGTPIHKQINNLKRQPNFVVGTPGRLKDLSDRGMIKFNSFTNIVLDEIDRMMDMGFVEEIAAILNTLPENKQSLFFSATMPNKINDLAKKFLKDPITVQVKTGETADNVDQDIVRSFGGREEKFNKLKDLLKQEDFSKVLIFSETKRDVDRLSDDLCSHGFSADSIHGDKKQRQREKALQLFKSNHINILVATDVAARGLDIKDISHVINYTVPQTYDDYIHRIGRTGRGTSKGVALTFVG